MQSSNICASTSDLEASRHKFSLHWQFAKIKNLETLPTRRYQSSTRKATTSGRHRATSSPRLCGPRLLLVLISLAMLGVRVCPANAAGVSIDDFELRRSMSEGQGNVAAASDVIAIKEGANLDLSCPIVVKNEDMIISWTCDDEPANIRSSRVHVTESGKLRIHSSKVGDSCNYRCEAADGHGALSVIIKVIIVDQRMMGELARRTHASANSSSLQTINETTGESRPHKRLIGGISHQRAAASHQRTLHDSSAQYHRPARPLASAPLKLDATIPPETSSDLEMQIEPAHVNVSKNQTVSLECRIKHASHLMAPHIIWLKEYMGAQVESIQDAIERNLIFLDGAYYHSLNWPRAISYSPKSSSASSALLIRHANYVHSGRYVCFAGYPSTVMSLDHNNSLLTSTEASSLGDASVPMLASRAPLKYKLARAIVKVDDKEGEVSYRDSSEWLAQDAGARADRESSENFRGPAPSLLMGVVSTNSWQRNVTIVLLIFCSSLMLVKFILVRRRTQNKSSSQQVPIVDATTNSPATIEPPVVTARASESYLMGDSLLPGASLADAFRDRLGDAPANSLIAGSSLLRDEYRIDQDLLNQRLIGIHETSGDDNNEHVYSEIGNVTTVRGSASTEEPYYKRPNKKL